MLCEIKELRKAFGGVKAIDGISLTIEEGEVCSVIGPNGAGKTTLFNLITGGIKPDSGKVLFQNRDITGRSSKFITECGISRSFQIVNIFPRLSVYENLMVAVLAKEGKTLNFFLPAKTLCIDECYSLIERIGLSSETKTLAGQLSHGNQKRLEVGLALAMKPKLLLLDEPTAGMAVEEKAGILDIVKQMTQEQGFTVFLCEHDMSVIFSISNSIWVVANGKVVMKGNVDEIRNSEIVRKIYLGEKE